MSILDNILDKSDGKENGSGAGGTTSSFDTSLTAEQIAQEIAKGLVETGVEGPFNTCEKTSGQGDDYISIGCSCWEGPRAAKLLIAAGLSQYTKSPYLDAKTGYTSYSKICQPAGNGSGKTHKDIISDGLDSEKGRSAQLAILANDTENYVNAIKSAVPNMTNSRCMIYAGIWCPTSTSCVQEHLKKNLGAINDLAALNKAFIDGPGCYALTSAGVGSAFVTGYANRGNKTYNYCMGLKDSDIGKLDLSKIKSVQDAILNFFSLSPAAETSASSGSVKVKSRTRHGDHSDTIYKSPDKLYCEPVYPDLVCPPGELPGTAVHDVMNEAGESELEVKANLEYAIPKETEAKYSNPGFAMKIMADDIVKEQAGLSFDLEAFGSMSKVPNGGKPPNDRDPFPIDEKIKEMELHAPRCKIPEIQTCPCAAPVTQECIKLSMNVERRLVHIENNIATILRYLSRYAARVPINCVYYGGVSVYDTHKCIRCLKDDRIEDGGLMTFDQCLTCTRFEPVLGQCYEILNDVGLNLSEVLDECQMSYTTPDEYIRFDSPKKRQDPMVTPSLDASNSRVRKSTDAEEDFESIWTPEMGVTMDWSLVPVEDQVPDINAQPGTLQSNVNTFTNSGTPMAGAPNVSNILVAQKPLMDALTEDSFGYETVQEAKEWISAASDSHFAVMNEHLYKDITEELNRRKSLLDALLVGAVSCVTGKNAAVVIEELENTKTALNGKGITSELLITQFHNLSRDNLFGDSGKGDDKVLRMRLDKVEKIVPDDDTSDNEGANYHAVGFGLKWGDIDKWNWTEYIEPLNINHQKNPAADSISEELKIIPKVIYLYCLFREKCASSRYDDALTGYLFPFRESDLPQVRYSSDFYNQRSYGYHSGIDLATNPGVDILAISDGVIVHTESGGGAGNAIALHHNDGLYSIYCHMQALEHKVGESISKGQVIGHVGYTGHCSPAGPDGSHLHLYINESFGGSFRNGAIDPERFFTRLAGKLGQFLA